MSSEVALLPRTAERKAATCTVFPSPISSARSPPLPLVYLSRYAVRDSIRDALRDVLREALRVINCVLLPQPLHALALVRSQVLVHVGIHDRFRWVNGRGRRRGGARAGRTRAKEEGHMGSSWRS